MDNQSLLVGFTKNRIWSWRTLVHSISSLCIIPNLSLFSLCEHRDSHAQYAQIKGCCRLFHISHSSSYALLFDCLYWSRMPLVNTTVFFHPKDDNVLIFLIVMCFILVSLPLSWSSLWYLVVVVMWCCAICSPCPHSKLEGMYCYSLHSLYVFVLSSNNAT